MKVDIVQSEEKSMFGKIKGYHIHCQITFSEEEKAIIASKNLKNVLLMELDMGEMGMHPITIGYLLTKGRVQRRCKTPIQAQDFTIELKEKLVDLKSYIAGSAQEAKSELFEL